MAKVQNSVELLQPHFRDKVKTWLAKLGEANLTIRITETLRTHERQADDQACG